MTDLSQLYRQQLVRLYGQQRAQASTVQPNDQGNYLISVAMPKGDQFILPAPVAHTQEEMERMIANLSNRRRIP